MVGEKCHQLFLVLRLEQVVDGACGQLGECFISRREDRERSGTLQGCDEARGFDGRDQGLKVTRARGYRDDVITL
jgi:hypothetical protein